MLIRPNVSPNSRSPKSITCHLWYFCFLIFNKSGRSFGLTSILIHLKTCEQKWETQESQKPAKERKTLPRRPDQLAKVFFVF